MPTDTRAEHWDEFEAMIDLHKFYFDQILKAAAFALVAISALTTYILQGMPHGTLGGPPKSLMVLPILMSAATAAVFWIGAGKAREFARDVKKMQELWGFGWRPHTELLGWMALVFAVIFSLLTVGITLSSLTF